MIKAGDFVRIVNGKELAGYGCCVFTVLSEPRKLSRRIAVEMECPLTGKRFASFNINHLEKL